jgi:phage-related tail fiber protein
MSVIKVGAIQNLNGVTDFDLVNNIINSSFNVFVPPGSIIFYSASFAPSGYLKANGAAVSRTTYLSLFNAIGTTFGSGDGSTTFNLPDLRGYFIRSFDDGAGVDSGRGFGSIQSDAFGSHNHGVNDPSHSHPPSSGLTQAYGFQPASSGFFTNAYAGGSVNNGYYTGGAYTGITIQSNGGTETRPKNAAFLACIKF